MSHRCAIVTALAGVLGSVASGATTTIVFKDGTNVLSSDSQVSIPGYNGTQDTTLNPGAPTLNYGSWIDWAVGDDGPFVQAAGVVRFDVSALAGQYVSVVGIKLRMNLYGGGLIGGPGVRNVNVYVQNPLDADWVEGTGAGPGGTSVPGAATWNERRDGLATPWSTPTLGAMVPVIGPGGQYIDFDLSPGFVNLTQVLNDWSSTTQNAGLRLELDASTAPGLGLLFGSQDNPTGVEGTPELVIEYIAVPAPGTGALLIAGALLVRRRRY